MLNIDNIPTRQELEKEYTDYITSVNRAINQIDIFIAGYLTALEHILEQEKKEIVKKLNDIDKGEN